jgi:hypothetical protein
MSRLLLLVVAAAGLTVAVAGCGGQSANDKLKQSLNQLGRDMTRTQLAKDFLRVQNDVDGGASVAQRDGDLSRYLSHARAAVRTLGHDKVVSIIVRDKDAIEARCEPCRTRLIAAAFNLPQ